MARNRSNIHYNQQTQTMSPSHTHTVGADANPPFADEEDLDDICPVCDGECTCANRSQPLPSDYKGNVQPAATLASPSATLVPSLQSLKIKLTVPPGMLSKARAAQAHAQTNTKKSKHLGDTMFDIADVGEGSSISARGYNTLVVSHSSASGNVPSIPKRRGRPPKATRNSAKLPGQDRPGAFVNEANTLPSSLSPSSSKNKTTKSRASSKAQSKVAKSTGNFTTLKKGKTIARSSPLKRKATVLSDNNTESDLTDLDEQGFDEDGIDDTESIHYPTFISASAMSTSTFSEDSETASSSSGFDSDTSLEAEEENFILKEERRHEKARVRRELLGGDGHKRKDGYNNWVIRARKQSVDPEDVEMEIDSDASEDEEDEEEGDDEGEEDDEMDESNPGYYAGVATGWSDEDEESSFDADLFFANLSDSTADGDSTSVDDDELADPNMDAAMIGPTEGGGRVQPDGLPFEVSHGWDGQIVFTNGVSEGHALLNHDFELSAAQLVDDSATPSQDSDVEMETTEGEDDGEYEDMDDQEGGESDGGDSTDDDYVGSNGLPTQRLLELFRWPASLSAIDPMSTVSPTVSPSPHNRRRKRSDTTSSKDSHSPRPADILAGKIFWADLDEQGRDNSSERRRPLPTRGGLPVMGRFEAGQDHPRRAILNGLNKDVPSPFPRVKHKKRTSSYSDCFDQFRGRTLTRPHSLSISTTSSGMTPLSSEEPSDQLSSDHPLGPPIDLHDVVDVSFLEPEPVDPLGLSQASASENETGRHMQSVERWGHIPMGTFRRTRESGAIIGDGVSTSWTAETPRVKPADSPFTPASASSILKSSPFSEIAWHSRPPKGTRRRLKPSRSIAISPVILPVRDGDRTPTTITHPSSTDSPPNEQQRKNRKEQRREFKMKRKNLGPVHHQHRQRQHQHFHHSHHPNMKPRSTNSIQRINFFSSPTSSVPPLNL